jgi:hypothetical protein
MKYTKIFESESDYELFRSGWDGLTPNICLVSNKISLKYNMVLFPAKLKTGVNGVLGIEVYNYLIENNIKGLFGNKIYVDDNFLPSVQENSDTSLLLTNGGHLHYILDNNGFITKLSEI